MTTKAMHDDGAGVPLDERLLRVRQVAVVLGISTRSVWRMAGRGLLNPVKRGGVTLWRGDEVVRLRDHGWEGEQ